MGDFRYAFMMQIDFITFTKLILPTNQTQSGRNVGNGERVNTLEGEDKLLTRVLGEITSRKDQKESSGDSL